MVQMQLQLQLQHRGLLLQLILKRLFCVLALEFVEFDIHFGVRGREILLGCKFQEYLIVD